MAREIIIHFTIIMSEICWVPGLRLIAMLKQRSHFFLFDTNSHLMEFSKKTFLRKYRAGL